MIFLGVYSCIIGALGVCIGASKDSRFYRFDDVVVRFLGVAFVILGVGLFLKWIWVLPCLAVVYLLSVVETAVTTATLPILVAAIILYGLPLLYLVLAIYK